MGMIGSIAGGVGEMFGGLQGIAGGKKRADDANDAQQYYEEDLNRYLKGYDRLNRKPTYQSQLVGPYQTTQSPLARQYLESMLTGDNMDAAKSPWANPNDVAATQARSDQRYGGINEIMQDERNQKAKPPAWQTKTPEEPEDRNPATRFKQYWEY